VDTYTYAVGKIKNGKFVLDERGRRILNPEGVSVDNTVSNMSRLCKLYGTMACKGDNTTVRPHRRSYLEIQDVKPVNLYSMIDEIIPADYRKTSHKYFSHRKTFPAPNTATRLPTCIGVSYSGKRYAFIKFVRVRNSLAE
jgi:hypothetical protein